MSTTKIGQVAPFPPLPGQPYPPARDHPRWKEIYRLHNEWILKYWPFSSEKKRARLPYQNISGFVTWSAPAGDFDRMVWVARLIGAYTLADDYIDSGRMFNRLDGYKQAATGTGPLHPEDRVELCLDIIFRAIKTTCHPRSFDQITRTAHEFWDSHNIPFDNLDQYLVMRRANVGIHFVASICRYTLDINLTDEQLNHPLMREAEGIVGDHIGIGNDYFSYGVEKLTNSDHTNVIRILQDKEYMSYEQAMKFVEDFIRQKEQDYIQAGMAVLEHPDFENDPEVQRWIACLPYIMGGNIAMPQQSSRYNLGGIPGVVPFPELSFQAEPTPEADIIDDTKESHLREATLNFDHVPELELTVDSEPIESSSQRIATRSCLMVSNFLDIPQKVRPGNVGITAIEVYLRKGGLDLLSESTIAASVTSLLSKHSIASNRIGRVDISLTTPSVSSQAVIDSIVNMMQSEGNADVEVFVSPNTSYASVTALVNATNWIESSSWDGRYALLVVENMKTNVVVLIGADASIVLEPYRGSSLEPSHPNSLTDQELVSSALQAAFSVYQHRREAWISRSGLSVSWETDLATTFFGFDYMIYDGAPKDLLKGAHDKLYAKNHQALGSHNIWLASKGQDGRGDLLSPILQPEEQGSPLTSLASVVYTVPSYDLFEKRIALFAYGPGEGSTYLSLRIKGDTKFLRDSMGLIPTGNSPTR